MTTKLIHYFAKQPLCHVRCFSFKPIKRPSVQKLSQRKTGPESGESASLLAKAISQRIVAGGPITIAEYMKQVLTNPHSGYYMSRDVFGPSGDFITSPEIGQIFGELIAVWFINEWRKIGSPEPVNLIELGPGKGTLAQDLLRVFSHLGSSAKISLHLVEISPFFAKAQAQRLCVRHKEIDRRSNPHYQYYCHGETISGIQIFWYERLDDVPNEFSMVVAHEFFDVLPIHKLERDGKLWKEILVDFTDEKFRLVMSRSETPISKIFKPEASEQRNSLEYSPSTDIIVESLAKRFEEHGGIGLIIDYGHNGDKTDTFRAFKNHQLHDPLVEPGTADLTADVDFRRIISVAEKNDRTITFGPVDQGLFLKNMGGEERLQALLTKALPDQVEKLKLGYDMLTNPEKMGARFKFLSIFPAVLKEHLNKYPISGF